MVEERHKKTSHSKCEVFNDCPLQGYFKYIIYAKPEKKWKDNAFVGKYSHECIQKWLDYYSDIDVSNLQYPAVHFSETMGAFYRENESRIPPKGASDAIGDDEAICLCLDNFIDFMVRRLDRVRKLNVPDQFAPIMVEKKYIQNINGVPLEGVLDAGFVDNQIWLIDWKTNKKPEITKKYVTQAVRYALLLDASGEFDKPISDFYVANIRTRIDLAKAHVIITEDMKKREEVELLRLWDLMNGDNFPKPGHNKNCFFCEYKLRCLSYPLQGAEHDWSIPVEYVSYRDPEPIKTTMPPGVTQADILAAAMSDPSMEDILSDLGIPSETPKEKPKDDFNIDDWWLDA